MCAIVPVPSSTMMYRCCHASAALMVHCSARSACLLGWHRHCIKASHVVKEMSVPFSVLPSWPALMEQLYGIVNSSSAAALTQCCHFQGQWQP